MEIRDYLIAERDQAQKDLAEAKAKLERGNFPEGRLGLSECNDYYKYYQVTGNRSTEINRKYIKAKDRKIASDLAMKSYLETSIYSAERKIKAINCYLRYYPQKTTEYIIKNCPGMMDLLKPQLPELQLMLDDWEKQPYEKNKDFPEHLIVPTLKGEMVRSKSEAMIADELFRRGIPYKYEYPIVFNDVTLHPDFHVLNKHRHKVYIWEHNGKMDDPGYIDTHFYKHNLFIRNGYIPQIDIIETYETKATPLTSIMINKTIDTYFGRG